MPITDAMIEHFAKTAIGETVTPFNEANAFIRVGNSNADFSADQTDLIGTKASVAMDTGYPKRAGNTLTFRATFGEAVANFAWLEWCVANAETGGTIANRKQESKGTKESGSWTFEVTLTPAYPVA